MSAARGTRSRVGYVRWLQCAVLAALAWLPACGPQAPPAPWAAAALERFEAEQTAARSDVDRFVQYFDPAFGFEMGAWVPGEGSAHGSAALARYLKVAYGDAFEELIYEEAFIDDAGAVIRMRVGPGWEALDQRHYGPAGIIASRISVGPLPDDHPLEPLAREYEAVWTSGDPSRVAALYEPDAVLLDRSVGVVLEGADQIGDLAASSIAGGRPFGPRDESTSEFFVSFAGHGPSTVTLVFDGGVARPCPGRAAVVLELEDTGNRQLPSVASERRFRVVEDVRRCVPDPGGGWWDDLEAVDPTQVQPASDRVLLADRWIEVIRPSEDRIGLLRCALERFAAAGLSPPELAAVTFETGTPRCTGMGGRVLSGGSDDAELVLCLTDEQIRPPAQDPGYSLYARTTILHELGHVWIESHLDETDRAAYLTQTGLTTWMGVDVAWHDRGGERAAEVLMWGLLDEDIPLPRLNTPACEVLQQEFRSLTGVDPLAPRCQP